MPFRSQEEFDKLKRKLPEVALSFKEDAEDAGLPVVSSSNKGYSKDAIQRRMKALKKKRKTNQSPTFQSKPKKNQASSFTGISREDGDYKY
jgi:hypothetical protein